MQKSIQPKLPVKLPDILSKHDANRPLHDSTFKNAVISFYNNRQALPGIIFTCEHSSNELPPQYRWSTNDKKLKKLHWGYDLGALRLSLGLAESLETAVVWAKYSRLLCDVNRTPGMSTMFRREAGERRVELNHGSGFRGVLDLEGQAERLSDYWFGYWSGVRKLLDHWKKDNANPKNGINPRTRYVFSVHSFNPIYEGKVRKNIEIGLLTVHYCSLAEYFKQGFTKAGYKTKINEPYNACTNDHQAGTACIPQGESPHSKFFKGYNREGKENILGEGVRHLVFEVRNDLLTDDKQFTRIRRIIVKLVNRLFAKGNPEYGISRPINKAPNPQQVEFENAVIMNWGGHKNEMEGQTRVCFSIENCSVNPSENMIPNLPKELEILLKKKQLGCPNVQKLAMSMAKEFDTILLSTKYTKAICDVTKPPTSQHILPKKIEFFENGRLSYQLIPFNKNLSKKEEALRMKKYYLGFYNGFQYVRSELGIQPHYWFSFRYFNKGHVHPTLIKKLGLKQLPDIILNTQYFSEVAARLAHALQYPDNLNTSLRVDCNGLINPKMHFDYANHTYLNSVLDRKSTGIIIYINDITIESGFRKVFEGLKTAFEKVCFQMHDNAETFRFLG